MRLSSGFKKTDTSDETKKTEREYTFFCCRALFRSTFFNPKSNDEIMYQRGGGQQLKSADHFPQRRTMNLVMKRPQRSTF